MWVQYKKIYILAALLFVLTAYFSVGFYQFDELTQVMEFAGFKLGLIELKDLSWEYEARIRPAIQPLMLYATHRVLAWVHLDNPFAASFALRLFSAALSFLSIHLLIRAFIDKIKGEKLKLSFVLLSFFLWFSVFNNVRFSSENIAGRLFVMAIGLFVIWKNENKKHYFLLGLLLGLSFIFRYQNAFLIVGFVAWLFFINKSKFKEICLLAIGILLMFGLGVLIDRWFYEEWVLSTWKYFEHNILLDRLSTFGVSPWYYYLVQIFNVGIPPFSLLYIVPFVLLVIFRSKDLLVWTILPFLLIHFYIGHKELRFIFPVIGFLPLLAVQAGEIINEKWKGLLQKKFFKVFVVLFWVYNSIFLCFVSFKAADAIVVLYEKVYFDYPQPTLLYCIKSNPYVRPLNVYYYKRKSLKVRKIASLNELRLPKDTVVLFATDNIEYEKLIKQNNTIIYNSLPEWVKMFNVFHWVERTHFWRVYEVKHLPPPDKK